MVNDFKRELSRISGVDFFNPKYRDVFKRYFQDDDKEEEVNAEEERLNEVIGDNNQNTETESEQSTDSAETEIEEKIEDEQTEDADNTAEDVSTDNSNLVEDEKTKTENEENSEPVVEPTTEPNKELIDAKVELELVKAGVREDRLEPAKRLVEPEVHSLEDLDKVKEVIKQFPEWLKDRAVNTKPFGMPVGEGNSDLTEEEKRLKAMGIDPRG